MASLAGPKRSKMDQKCSDLPSLLFICATRAPSWQSWVQMTRVSILHVSNNQHYVPRRRPRNVILELYRWVPPWICLVDWERLRGRSTHSCVSMIVKLNISFTGKIILWDVPEAEDLLSFRMLSAHLNVQVISLLENATSHEYLALPVRGAFNSPSSCQLQMLFDFDIFLEFPSVFWRGSELSTLSEYLTMDSESLKPTDIYKKHRGAVSVGCVTNGRRHSPLVDLAAIIAMQLALFTHHTIIPQSIVEWFHSKGNLPHSCELPLPCVMYPDIITRIRYDQLRCNQEPGCLEAAKLSEDLCDNNDG